MEPSRPLTRRGFVCAAGGTVGAIVAALPALAQAPGGADDAAGDAARWLDGDRPSALCREAVSLLAAAEVHGLDPRDYEAAMLERWLAGADEGRPEVAMRLAAALVPALRRFLADLAFGRVDPRSVHQRFSVAPRAGFDPAAALNRALARGRLDEAVAAAAPPLPAYARLVDALAAMRALAGHRAWAQTLPPLPASPGSSAGRLDPGAAWAGLPTLAERLALLGDFAPRSSADRPPTRYEGALVDAVRAFQSRHGLTVDGVVGRATLAALEVTPAARARQIALTMERLRWTPLVQGPRMVVVNIPEFVLRAYEVVDGTIRMHAQMRVIVGGALDKQTPLFDERMRAIEFSPYWNVPPSIARRETVPRLRRDPGYWQSQGFEFVDRRGAADAVLTPAKLDAVLAGTLRIRQRPGPVNALGDIKFVFPNRDHIFLHHTPAVGLFERDRRDFSHGCIRVADPVALARFVMAGMPGWDDLRIRAAMQSGTSTTVALAHPLPVLIAYATVLVEQGHVHFFTDLYGNDARLQAALDARRTRPPPGLATP